MTNPVQPLLDRQREHFLTDATKSLDWRLDQLDRMVDNHSENRADQNMPQAVQGRRFSAMRSLIEQEMALSIFRGILYVNDVSPF